MNDIALGVFGIDERNQYGLSLAFRQHQPNNYSIIPVGHADIVLVDGDAIGAAEAITQEMTRRPRRGLLVLTLVKQYDLADHHAVQVLTKPVTVTETLSALDDLSLTIGTNPPSTEPLIPSSTIDLTDSSMQPTGRSAPPIPEVRPGPAAPQRQDRAFEPHPLGPAHDGSAVNGQRDRLRPLPNAWKQLMDLIVGRGDRLVVSSSGSNEQYDPAQHLDGCLATIIAAAHRLGRPTALVDDGDGVSYDPRTQMFTSTGYFDWLDDLALSARPCAQYMTDDAAGLFLATYARRSSSAVLWRAAVLASKGRLRAGIDSSHDLQLRHWPNMTQLDHVEGVLPILAAVSARSLSIDGLVDEGHEPHVVNATIAGLAAIGALDFGPGLRATWRADDAPDDRGLISRLLRR